MNARGCAVLIVAFPVSVADMRPERDVYDSHITVGKVGQLLSLEVRCAAAVFLICMCRPTLSPPL